MSLTVEAVSSCSKDMEFEENKDQGKESIKKSGSESSFCESENEGDEVEDTKIELGPQCTLKDQLEKDKDDESLRKWKEQLLGNVDINDVGESLEAEVKILSLSILSPGRSDIVLAIPTDGKPKGSWFTLKEGSRYSLRFSFQVKHNIVSGLKYTNNVWKTGVKVDNTKQMLGTFSPQQEAYTYDMPEETTPSGYFARGSYSAKTKFVDDDNKCYLEISYTFDIRKDWARGNRFAFIRIIKVDDIDRLVANLCTIWIGRFHLHENVARFLREHKPSAPSHPSNTNERNLPGSVYWVRAKEMEACDPFIYNDSYERKSSDDEEDAKDDWSQSRDKVTADNDVERVSKSSCMNNNDLLYDNKHNNIMPDKGTVLSNDLFNLYDVLNKRKDSGDDLKYPPASLIDLPLDGYAYTWAHKTANKISKLDRFLYLLDLCLDRNLSDHRPILMREVSIDYGPTPFIYFHSWFNLDGFDKMVEDTWKIIAIVDSNAIRGTLVDGKWIVDPLSLEQQVDLERNVSNEEIKSAVWDCGTNKSPGPDGFTSHLISDIQSAFVSNRQILDSLFILNVLLSWCKHKKFKAMDFKVDFEKAFDSIWDYLQDILKMFDFGDKGVGIPIDNSLALSHLIFMDDSIFVGKWDSLNICTIVNVLKCFHLASGLKINVHKSKLIRIGTRPEEVDAAATTMGCSILTTPFVYLRVKVGGAMSRIKSWDDMVAKVEDGALNTPSSLSKFSPWLDIIREVTILRTKGIHLLDLIRKKAGNRLNTLFWEDLWLDDLELKHKFMRLYALDNYKQITVFEKINHASMVDTIHRPPRGGAEEE
uniref:Rho GDP-dissociation inhibitor 1-like n=1 Tax=Tanacetum cinerariifolium TaxID=118510 RepID=A0A6L2LAK8_TANCI|nr:Rho GDP-dissociation inhibitor 1-like [Tanacetum cinerariifolium]